MQADTLADNPEAKILQVVQYRSALQSRGVQKLQLFSSEMEVVVRCDKDKREN